MFKEWGCGEIESSVKDSGLFLEEQQFTRFGNAHTHATPLFSAPSNPLGLPSLDGLPASLEWDAGSRMGGNGFGSAILNDLTQAIKVHEKLALPNFHVSNSDCPLNVNNKIVQEIKNHLHSLTGDNNHTYSDDGLFVELWDCGMMFYNIDLEYILNASISRQKRDLIFRLIAFLLKTNDIVDLDTYVDWSEERLEEYYLDGEEELDEEDDQIWFHEGSFNISVSDAKRDLALYRYKQYWFSFVKELDTENLETDLQAYKEDQEFKRHALRLMDNSRTLGNLSQYVVPWADEEAYESAYSYFYISPDSNNYVAYDYMSNTHDKAMNVGCTPLGQTIPYESLKTGLKVPNLSKTMYNYVRDLQYTLIDI